jgi:hypothetical protein
VHLRTVSDRLNAGYAMQGAGSAFVQGGGAAGMGHFRRGSGGLGGGNVAMGVGRGGGGMLSTLGGAGAGGFGRGASIGVGMGAFGGIGGSGIRRPPGIGLGTPGMGMNQNQLLQQQTQGQSQGPMQSLFGQPSVSGATGSAIAGLFGPSRERADSPPPQMENQLYAQGGVQYISSQGIPRVESI